MAYKKTVADTDDLDLGMTQEFVIPSVGKLDRTAFLDEFESVDTPNWKELAKMEAFYDDEVEIVISETDAPNAENIIQLGVNGVNQFLIRGIPQIVKRKFVEVLCHAQPENLSTPEYIDPNGNRATKVVKTKGLKYPFRVLRDSSPDGRRWLESILRTA
jgi:hypothetical protein